MVIVTQTTTKISATTKLYTVLCKTICPLQSEAAGDRDVAYHLALNQHVLSCVSLAVNNN